MKDRFHSKTEREISQTEEDTVISDLRDQNARLKDVIKQMSADIENIAAQNKTQVRKFELVPAKQCQSTVLRMLTILVNGRRAV